MCPYYNKPTQAGLYEHYRAIHDETDIPIVLYNVPGRTVIEIESDTIAKLSQLPRIVAVKDATDNLSNPPWLRAHCAQRFDILSGEDGTYAGFLAMGGDGIISVVGNVAPQLNAQLYETWKSGDLEKFAQIRDKLAPLASALFCETNPVPVKYAASLLGLANARVRRPLVELEESSKEKVRKALQHAGLL